MDALFSTIFYYGLAALIIAMFAGLIYVGYQLVISLFK
jgi:hypothetical protein